MWISSVISKARSRFTRPRESAEARRLVEELAKARKSHKPVKHILKRLHEVRFGGSA